MSKMNGQQGSLLSVPGGHRKMSDIRRPQARRSSAVAIVFTRGESISIERAARRMSRSKRMSISRDFKMKTNPWNTFLGDCSIVDAYLSNKPREKPQWAILHFLNIFFRAIGQPAFVNNPLCGAMIFASFFINDWLAAMGCVIGCGIAVLANMVLRLHPWPMVRNGLSSLNGCLIGVAGMAMYPTLRGRTAETGRPAELWAFVAVGALLSVYVSKALHRSLGRMGAPYMTLPFNMVITCVFLALRTIDVNETVPVASNAEIESTSDNVDWLMALRGVLVSFSQVWGIDDPITAGVIAVGMLLFSPLLTVFSCAGAVVGTGLGLLLLPSAHLAEVYSGVWGYNTLLVLTGTACVFYPLTPQSALMGVVASCTAFVVQIALRANMTLQNSLPVFLWPQVLTMLVLLMVTSEEDGGWLKRIDLDDITYPEKQFWAWYKGDRLRLARISMSENNDIDEEDEAGDEMSASASNNRDCSRIRGRNNSSSLGDNMIMPYADEDDASEAGSKYNIKENDVRL